MPGGRWQCGWPLGAPQGHLRGAGVAVGLRGSCEIRLGRIPSATLEDLAHAQRICVYGVTGAGKSFAARRLGSLLGLPVHLVDEEIGWLPGWTQRPVDEQRALAERLTSQDTWILDTSYGSFLGVVLSRTQVVVGLDYSRWVTLARLIRRTLSRIMTREPICNGNVESWSQVFSRDSIIWWHATSFRRKRNRMRAWQQADTGPAVLLLAHPRQLTVLLNELERTARVQAG